MGHHVKGQIFSSYFKVCRQIFEKSSNTIKSHENPSSGSRVVPCGRTDRQVHVINITVACRNFSKSLTHRVGVNVLLNAQQYGSRVKMFFVFQFYTNTFYML